MRDHHLRRLINILEIDPTEESEYFLLTQSLYLCKIQGDHSLIQTHSPFSHQEKHSKEE